MLTGAKPNDWPERLGAESDVHHSLALLDAVTMAENGEIDGWYVAPLANDWTIGREVEKDDGGCRLVADGEPILFKSMLEAAVYLRRLLAQCSPAEQPTAPLTLVLPGVH